jgi:crossover junction endodeoxyribonuclease RuvC
VIILAIDPGTRCGWCVRHDERRIDAGTWELAPRRYEGAGMRYLRLRAVLRELLDGVKPEAVAFEQVRRHMGVEAAHVYGGIVAVVMEECESRKIPYHGIAVQDVKKTATGKGNAKKDAMIAAANERWGLTLGAKDENEADARWIAETAARELPA